MPWLKWRHRLPVVGAEGLLYLVPFGSVRLFHPDRCGVARELFWHDGILASPQDRHALAGALAFARKARTFLDVGAYTGLFALAAARVNPTLKGFAYEIVGENYLILIENILRNDLVGRVEPRLTGVAAAAGQMTLPFSMNVGALASSVALDWSNDQGIRVPLETLDDLHLDARGPVAMKIDVEGFEMEVFDGGRRFLERHRPDMVCEVLRRAKRVGEMRDLLGGLGYRFLHITAHGFAPRQEIVADKHQRDWLFTTRDDDELRSLGIPVLSQ
jgi:FkbM family methyltransferase